VYVPSYFAEQRREVLHDFMRSNSFAILVVDTAAGPIANHLPLHLDAQRGVHGTLVGHVARANPVWREALAETPALAVFSGAHAYVSPSWYASRASGEVVPTWNYAAVHARGPLRFFTEPKRLRHIVATLTETNEQGRARRWQVDEASAPYIERMLTAIIGFELDIAELTGKFKASQNRAAADRAGVARALEAAGMDAATRAMLVREPGKGDGNG
jgi:transcriptional regulator